MLHTMTVKKRKLPTGIAVLDVGGTFLKAGVINNEYGIVTEPIEAKAEAQAGADWIIDTMGDLLTKVTEDARSTGLDVSAAAVCIPGPFDYCTGVSKMSHKLTGIHSVDLRSPLQSRLELDVIFLNDADAFGRGVSVLDHDLRGQVVGITLGTGIGSAFLVDGELTTDAPGVPPDGEIWLSPFHSGIFEDYVSAAAVARQYRKIAKGRETSVREIAERARAGEEAAITTFRSFGELLGEGLGLFLADFAPDRIAVGGKIARAWDLFGDITVDGYRQATSTDTPFFSYAGRHAAIIGAGDAALASRADC